MAQGQEPHGSCTLSDLGSYRNRLFLLHLTAGEHPYNSVYLKNELVILLLSCFDEHCVMTCQKWTKDMWIIFAGSLRGITL